MIKAYEAMLENIKAFEAAQVAENGQLAAAAAEVDQALQRYNALLEKALEDPELAPDIAKAQGMVTIAETKLQRLRAKLDAAKKPYPDGIAVAFQKVQAEIQRKLNDGSLLREEFQPLLDEMQALGQVYMEKMKALGQVYMEKMKELLVKKCRVNNDLLRIQKHTQTEVKKYTDNSPDFGFDGPKKLEKYHFTDWVWLNNDHSYHNEIAKLDREADDIVNG